MVGVPHLKPYNHDQSAMVVINYQDQLQSGTFEHAVHYLIEHKLDLSIFHPSPQRRDRSVLRARQSIAIAVGRGTRIRQHWHDGKAEPLQPAGQEEGARPVAALLPGAQH